MHTKSTENSIKLTPTMTTRLVLRSSTKQAMMNITGQRY